MKYTASCFFLLLSVGATDTSFEIVAEKLSSGIWVIEKQCVNDSCSGGGSYCVFDISGKRTNAMWVSYSVYEEVMSLDTTFQWRLNSCTPYFIFDSAANDGVYEVVVYSNEAGKTKGTFTFTSDTAFILSFNDSTYYQYYFRVAQPPEDLLKMIERR